MIQMQLLPVLERCTTWMLRMKIQANREEHTDAGPLRKQKVTGSWEGSERTSWRRQHLSLALKSEEDLDR